MSDLVNIVCTNRDLLGQPLSSSAGQVLVPADGLMRLPVATAFALVKTKQFASHSLEDDVLLKSYASEVIETAQSTAYHPGRRVRLLIPTLKGQTITAPDSTMVQFDASGIAICGINTANRFIPAFPKEAAIADDIEPLAPPVSTGVFPTIPVPTQFAVVAPVAAVVAAPNLAQFVPQITPPPAADPASYYGQQAAQPVAVNEPPAFIPDQPAVSTQSFPAPQFQNAVVAVAQAPAAPSGFEVPQGVQNAAIANPDGAPPVLPIEVAPEVMDYYNTTEAEVSSGESIETVPMVLQGAAV